MKINSITNYPQIKQKKPSFEAKAKYEGFIRPLLQGEIRTKSRSQLQSTVIFNSEEIEGKVVTTLDFPGTPKEKAESFFSRNFGWIKATFLNE